MTRWSWMIVGLWVIVALLYFNIFGTLEGRVFPVLHNFNITKVEPHQEGIWIYGTFEKVRDCDFVALRSYLEVETDQDTIARSSILVRFDDGSVIRHPGSQIFGPWYVSITENQLPQLRVKAQHQCHHLWLTTTDIITGF